MTNNHNTQPDPTAYLRGAPKTELHVHLEGAIQPATLLALARRNKIELPGASVDGLREWFAFRDFRHFLQVYLAITKCFRCAQDYEFVAYEFGREMARQNIRYAEVTFSPSTHDALGIPQQEYLDGLSHGRARAVADFGITWNWVFDIVRSVADPAQRSRLADFTTSLAIENRENGVVALGLGGFEAEYPAREFGAYFDRARAAGLHSAPHSGETAGPESIWDSVNLLGAERLGHGVRAIEDAALVRYLADKQIPLEVNPTSNVCLGIYAGYAAHPLRTLHESGVIITVNSDDPPLFNTSLTDELMLLSSAFGLDQAAIETIRLNAARHSFLPQEAKAALMREMESPPAAEFYDGPQNS